MAYSIDEIQNHFQELTEEFIAFHLHRSILFSAVRSEFCGQMNSEVNVLSRYEASKLVLSHVSYSGDFVYLNSQKTHSISRQQIEEFWQDSTAIDGSIDKDAFHPDSDEWYEANF